MGTEEGKDGEDVDVNILDIYKKQILANTISN